jgi:DNA polymerase III epsilon subunit-like protein
MICIDLETTGISPIKNCMVSLGAVDYESDDSFYGECQIYLDSEIEPIALEINGFTEEQIRDCSKRMPFQLYADFVKWAEGKENVLAGHNVGHFDILFLEQIHQAYFSQHKFPFSHRTIDIHSVGYALFYESLKLDQLGEKLGLGSEPKPHNALIGARFGKAVLKELIEQIQERL